MYIKNEQAIPAAQVKKILTNKAKDKELAYEQKITLEHLKKFSKLSEKDTTQLQQALAEIAKLKEKHIVAIIDNLPQDLDDIRLLFSNERVDLSDDHKKKILAAVKAVS